MALGWICYRAAKGDVPVSIYGNRKSYDWPLGGPFAKEAPKVRVLLADFPPTTQALGRVFEHQRVVPSCGILRGGPLYLWIRRGRHGSAP